MRDDKGNFIVGGNWRIQYCADALTAEAVALRFGLQLAQKTGCNRLIINSDNMEVIDTMNNGGQSAGAAAAIFEDCFFMACDVPQTSFEHCNREANKVAHMTSDWIEEPMKNLVTLLIDDVTIIAN
ncbi:hypothetical protein VPH35_060309 [Triticum aestivum]